MELTKSKENEENVLQSKENNISRDMTYKFEQSSVFGKLNFKQNFNKQTSSKSKHHETYKICFSTKYSVSFTVYEDDSIDFKKLNEKFFDSITKNRKPLQKPLLLKNNSKICETNTILPKMELEEKLPLSDITNIIQPSVIVRDIQRNQIENAHCIDEITNFSNVNLSLSVTHGKPTRSSCNSVHQLTSDIDNIYASELYAHLRDIEKLYCPKPEYMKKQPHITYNMRAILVDWLVKVTHDYEMQNETLYLTISLIDRFLSLISVGRAQLQLLGIVALFVASKYEEIDFPNISFLIYLTNDTYTKKQVLKMEQLILKVLEFNMSNCTTIIFLTHICVQCNVPLKVMYLAMYLAELCLLEADPYLSYMPSIIGCGAISLAMLILDNEDIWPEEMSTLTKYCLNDLIPVLQDLNCTYKGSISICTQLTAATRLKFKSPKFYNVSEIEYKDLVIPKKIIKK